VFQVKSPILAAMGLDRGLDDLLCQMDALARSNHVILSVYPVLPEIFAVRALFPQLHLDEHLKLSELEDAVRDAFLARIRTERFGRFGKIHPLNEQMRRTQSGSPKG
jgi:hypothetical protein